MKGRFGSLFLLTALIICSSVACQNTTSKEDRKKTKGHAGTACLNLKKDSHSYLTVEADPGDYFDDTTDYSKMTVQDKGQMLSWNVVDKPRFSKKHNGEAHHFTRMHLQL